MVGHLHDPRVGVRRRGPGTLLAFCALVLLLDLRQRLLLLERPSDPLLALARRALPGRRLAPRRGRGVFLELLAKPGHLRLGLLEALLQALLAPKRGGARLGADAHAVLRHALQRHMPSLYQRGHVLAQEQVELLATLGAEVGERVIARAHPAADPAVGEVRLAELGDRPGAAHRLDRGVEPEGQQDRRIDRGTACVALARLDPVVERREVLLLDEGPDQSRGVVGRQQGVEVAGQEHGVGADRADHAGGAPGRGRRPHRFTQAAGEQRGVVHTPMIGDARPRPKRQVAISAQPRRSPSLRLIAP